MHGCQGQQEMLYAVAREDHDGAIGGEAAGALAQDQGGGDIAHAPQGLVIGERLPGPAAVALRNEDAVGCLVRPVFQPVGDTEGIFPQ